MPDMEGMGSELLAWGALWLLESFKRRVQKLTPGREEF